MKMLFKNLISGLDMMKRLFTCLENLCLSACLSVRLSVGLLAITRHHYVGFGPSLEEVHPSESKSSKCSSETLETTKNIKNDVICLIAQKI